MKVTLDTAKVGAMLQSTDGKKTYFFGVCIIAATAAQHFGYITEKQFETLLCLFNGGGLIALRAAKIGAKPSDAGTPSG